MNDQRLTMVPEIRVGDTVALAYAQELRADGTEHIPACKAMRGTVLSIRESYVQVQWRCDCTPSHTYLQYLVKVEE